METAGDTKLDPAVVAALYAQHTEELRCFVLGVLRDPDLTLEVLQNTFAKAIECGHTAQQETLKGWLFRVAFNEAMGARRRQAVRDKATRVLAELPPVLSEAADELVCRRETIARVRDALERLSAEQQQVVRMRIYEQKKFNEIAQELGLPLGTVLTRMQAALRKLRGNLTKD